VTIIASRAEVGTLYGAFRFLRLIQTGQSIAALDLTKAHGSSAASWTTGTTSTARSSAANAGRSLWKWDELPGRVDPRVQDYAARTASIGINGSVINSVTRTRSR